MTFLVTNLACFLLKIGSAPNFRPSFHFFNWQTAALGAIVCATTMFVVDGVYASACVALLMVLFLLIHYTAPPKPWGDVSQSLIYHQVRKYLLRLRQEHVKFWRPQILLLVNDPRRQYKLIQFCNSLKKGGLFVLGHVIVNQSFADAVPEARRQQQSWTKYIDFSRIKAFVNIAISPTVEWGARNIVLNAGLGGMRPNIVMMGFYNLPELRQSNPRMGVPSPQPSRPSSKATNRAMSLRDIRVAARQKEAGKPHAMLPTDAMKPEDAIGIQNYVTIIEDLVLRLQANVAVAKGFQELETPSPLPSKRQRMLSLVGLGDIETTLPSKTYIDLWPIQMSAEIATAGDEPSRKNVLTTNFDTYTLILQLGCILHTVPSWKRTYKLRVCVFVEYETDVEEERKRVTTLLKNLRIEAEVLVFWLARGDLKMYEVIVNGRDDGAFDQTARDIDYSLEDEKWWQDIKRLRQPEDLSASQEFSQAVDLLERVTQWPTASFQHGRRETMPKRFNALHRMIRKAKNRASAGNISEMGVSLSMRSQRLSIDLLHDSDSEGSRQDADDEGDGDDADDEAVESGSEVAISASNFDDYEIDHFTEGSGDENRQQSPKSRLSSRMSSPRSGLLPVARSIDLRRAIWKGSPKDSSPMSETLIRDQLGSPPLKAIAPKDVLGQLDSTAQKRRHKAHSNASSTSQVSSSSQARSLTQLPRVGSHSIPKFISNPTPRTAVSAEESAGPSIMFVDTPSPTTARLKDPIATAPPVQSQNDTISTQTRTPNPQPPQFNPSTSHPQSPIPAPQPAPASGYPLPQSLPLSFNDLPCRAQHLILNELMRTHSDSANTAVVFTTLPSPMAGTCDSELESVKYISDLEVLCQGLPPVLMVHSNSMTVTMNL